jgi:hypothetical protein
VGDAARDAAARKLTQSGNGDQNPRVGKSHGHVFSEFSSTPYATDTVFFILAFINITISGECREQSGSEKVRSPA